MLAVWLQFDLGAKITAECRPRVLGPIVQDNPHLAGVNYYDCISLDLVGIRFVSNQICQFLKCIYCFRAPILDVIIIVILFFGFSSLLLPRIDFNKYY